MKNFPKWGHWCCRSDIEGHAAKSSDMHDTEHPGRKKELGSGRLTLGSHFVEEKMQIGLTPDTIPKRGRSHYP